MQLQSTEINKFFKSLDLKPTWVNGQTIDEINTNIEINKESLNKVDAMQFKQVSETWNEQNVISNFEFNFNLALNTYKNV
jgi:tRNA G18 (ribose-2'-O)-methylase SpoU